MKIPWKTKPNVGAGWEVADACGEESPDILKVRLNRCIIRNSQCSLPVAWRRYPIPFLLDLELWNLACTWYYLLTNNSSPFRLLMCVWYLMFELSVFLFLWHCCTRTISARAAQYWGWAPNRKHSCVVVFIIFIFMSFDIGRRRVLLTMKYILIIKQNAPARWHCNAEYQM